MRTQFSFSRIRLFARKLNSVGAKPPRTQNNARPSKLWAMRFRLYSFIALMLAACTGFGQVGSVSTGSQKAYVPPVVTANNDSPGVSAFYYSWWVGNQWGANTQFLPELGNYDSGSPAVINQHMIWAKQAGLNSLIYSWWGQSTVPISLRTDAHLLPVMQAAAPQGIQIIPYIDVYAGRTQASISSDVGYLLNKIGTQPNLYRSTRATPFFAAGQPRPVFMMYISVFDNTAWNPADYTAMNDYIHNTYGAIMLVNNANPQLEDPTWVTVGHFDGIIEYSIVPTNNDSVWMIGSLPPNAWYVPTVTPGFDAFRSKGWTGITPRDDGETFSAAMARSLGINASTPLMTITSFNEWTESTQIEPDGPGVASDGFVYETYDPLPANGYLAMTNAYAGQAAAYTSYDYSSTNTITTAPDQASIGLYQNSLGPNSYTDIDNPSGPAYEISSGSLFMYFQMDKHFLPPTPGPVTISVDYYDTADSSRFRVDWDGGTGAVEENSPSVTCKGTLKWRTAIFSVPDINVDGTMHDYQDFRIHNLAGNPQIGRVSVTRDRGTGAGTVVDGNGNPISAALVQVTDSTGYVYGSVNTNSTGNYSVPGLPPGTFTFTATAPGYLPNSASNVAIAINTTTAVPLALTLNAGTLSGNVTDSNGNPILGASIAVQNTQGSNVSISTTDVNGYYSISAVPVGTYTTVVSAAGFNPSSNPTTVTLDTTTTLNAALAPLVGSISGTVSDQNGSPLQNALVNVTDQSGDLIAQANTDVNGIYNFIDLSPLPYNITVSLTGYITATFPMAVVANEVLPEATTLQIITGSATGNVTDSNGIPIAGVMISLSSATNSFMATTTTDVNGNFVFKALDPGSYSATYSVAGYSPVVQSNIVVMGGVSTPLTQTLQITPGAAFGSVTDGSGNALAGVSVSLENSANSVATATTNATGGFVFNNLVPGQYSATFQDSGYNPVTEPVVITAGSSANLNATLQLIVGSASGNVVDQNQNPLSGVSVSFTLSSQSTSQTATSDSNGNFTCANLLPGQYSVSYQLQGYAGVVQNSVSITGNNTTQVSASLQLIVGSISGNVTDSNGNILPGVSVSITGSSNAVAGTATTDSSGNYTVNNLVPGTYSANFQDAGFAPVVQTGIVVAGNAATTSNAALNSIIGVITGLVTDVNGNPLSDVTVTFSNRGASTPTSTTTGATGTYSCGGLVAGQYSATFQAPGYTNSAVANIAVVGGGTTTTNATLAFVGAYPLPAISSLTPTSVNWGGSGFTLTITGSNFTPASCVKWSGKGLPTTYISPTQLQASVSSVWYAIKKVAAITVTNPKPGGGTSGGLNLTVD